MAWKNDTDVLSLTLPKGRGRSARKRWKRPPGFFWVQLAVSILAALLAAFAFLQGDWPFGCFNTWTTIVSWKGAMAIKDERRLHPWWIKSQLINVCLALIFLVAG